MAICWNNYITLFSLASSRMLLCLVTSPDWSRRCIINVYREVPLLIKLTRRSSSFSTTWLQPSRLSVKTWVIGNVQIVTSEYSMPFCKYSTDQDVYSMHVKAPRCYAFCSIPVTAEPLYKGHLRINENQTNTIIK